MGLAQFLSDALGDSFGRLVKLRRLLSERPDIQASLQARSDSISGDCVVRWDQFGLTSSLDWSRREHGQLMGWRQTGGRYYESFSAHRPEFEQLVQKIFLAFHEVMESLGATWLWTYMPRPYNETKAILLPKGERRALRVAAVFREAGALDLGAYLEALTCCGTAIYQT